MAPTDERLPPKVNVNDLTFAFPDGSTGLEKIGLELPANSRTLLIGGMLMSSNSITFPLSNTTSCIANGAGKTTLLRLLSGKRMAPKGTVSIAGVDPFTTGLEGVTYLGMEWTMNSITRTDIDVPTLLSSVGGDAYPERRDELVRILDVDMKWRLHAVSDGERRRVQLCMGLIRPWTVLLLDEITVDLDLLSRYNFLQFLKRETETRSCTIVYATHILDNLADWPTHLVHMSLGKVRQSKTMETLDVEAIKGGRTGNSLLGELVLEWLREDLAERGPRNGQNSEGKTYESFEGKGGYGSLKAPAREG
jgi:CCR4-NOT complex subunit CAF16